MKKHLLLGALALAGCREPELIDNSQFDAWCGERPCGWEVDGDVERVGTWHPDDYAVALVSRGARVHQLITVDDVFGGCMAFSMLAQVDEGSAVIELDFLDDGEVDWSESIPESDYDSLSFNVSPPRWFDSVRVSVRKTSAGVVRIARLRALLHIESCGGRRIELDNLPGEAPCEDDDECASGQCAAGTCEGCVDNGDCDDGGVCGYARLEDDGSLSVQCTAPRSRDLGELCRGDAECQSGVCCDSVCSACCNEPAITCFEPDQQCVAVEAPEDSLNPVAPHVCVAIDGEGTSGAHCTSNADCASGMCTIETCSQCTATLIGQQCARFDTSCADPDDPSCCFLCSEEHCRITELSPGTCQ